jgi:hypothetical protein
MEKVTDIRFGGRNEEFANDDDGFYGGRPKGAASSESCSASWRSRSPQSWPPAAAVVFDALRRQSLDTHLDVPWDRPSSSRRALT